MKTAFGSLNNGITRMVLLLTILIFPWYPLAEWEIPLNYRSKKILSIVIENAVQILFFNNCQFRGIRKFFLPVFCLVNDDILRAYINKKYY